MSTIRLERLENPNTSDGGIDINSSGNVGIGTSPNNLLEVRGTSSGQNVLHLSNSAGTTDGSAENQVRVTCNGNSNWANLDIQAYQTIFTQNATERARIDSSGRLLVGTPSTSSTSPIVVQGYVGVSAGAGEISITRGGTPSIADQGLGTIRFQNNNNNTGAQIDAFSDGSWTAGSNHQSRLVFSTTANGDSSPTEQMRITSDGKFSFGGQGAPYNSATCDSYSSTAGHFAHAFRQDSATGYGVGIGIDGTYLAYFYPNKDLTGSPVGSISHNGTNTSFNTSSDYRLKENVVPLTGATDRLNQLQVHRFNFIADPDTTVDGFIAHEAQEVVPECVTGIKDEVDADGNPVYQGIDQSKLVPLLTAALQEAIAKIETLEAKVAALEVQ